MQAKVAKGKVYQQDICHGLLSTSMGDPCQHVSVDTDLDDSEEALTIFKISQYHDHIKALKQVDPGADRVCRDCLQTCLEIYVKAACTYSVVHSHTENIV